MSGLKKNLLTLLLAVLLVACLVVAYLTRGAGTVRSAPPGSQAASAAAVDQHLIQTARQVAPLADTAAERGFAQEALRLADHQTDQAFATALREAAAATPAAAGPLKQLADHIAQLKDRIAKEQDRIAKLTPQAAAGNDKATDQLELVKAQVALDQDELDDNKQDLSRQGGDPEDQVQRALDAYQTAQKEAQPPKAAVAPPTGTLQEQMAAWLSLRARGHQLEDARQQAAAKASTLAREHDALEALVFKKPAPSPGAQAADAGQAAPSDDQGNDEERDQEDTGTMVAQLKHLSDQRKTLTELDKRTQDVEQLAGVYKSWGDAVETRRRSLLSQLLASLAIVLAILLAVVVITRVIRRSLYDPGDRKRLHQVRVVAEISVQATGVLAILLVIFGPPTQLSTIIGLATAGLTVALKDFIVAFFGWFALIGRNGVRIGDWVEIEGVSGEVIEIGLLKTTLLEMGNWTSTGHPTGRRVSFMNTFAIEKHYFNFSTAGQWLWDELHVLLPADRDPYAAVAEIRALAEKETEADARAAEQDWERVTRQYGSHSFSASPAADLRPVTEGLEAVVRYITRAPERYEMKSKLFAAIVDLLRKPEPAAS